MALRNSHAIQHVLSEELLRPLQGNRRNRRAGASWVFSIVVTLALALAAPNSMLGADEAKQQVPAPPVKTMFAKGQVVDEAMNPVADAIVYACVSVNGGLAGYAIELQARTDAEGWFTIEGLQPRDDGSGGYPIYAGKTGYAWGRAFLNTSFIKTSDMPFPAGVSDIQIVLAKPGTLSGRVLSKDGRPVTGALVLPDSFLGGFPSGSKNLSFLSATTNAQGIFRLDNLPQGATCRLVVEAEGFTPITRFMYGESRLNPRPLFTVGDNNVEIRLTPESRIVGRVIYEKNGAPVPGMHVSAEDMQHYWVRDRTISDEKGEFTLKGLLAGPTRISFLQEGLLWSLVPPKVVVDLQEGQTLEGVVGKVPDSVPITARVFDKATGKPIMEGYIAVRENANQGPWSSWQFAQGEDLKARVGRKGYYALRVHVMGYERQVVELDMTDQKEMKLQDIKLEPQVEAEGFTPITSYMYTGREPQATMPPSTTWRLLVVDEEDRPVPEATLRRSGVPVGITGPDGRVECQELEPFGRGVRILIRAPQRHLVGLFIPPLPPDGNPPPEAKVVLKKPGVITGVVKDTQGNPVKGIGVGSAGYGVRLGVSDETGRFSIRDVPEATDVPLYAYGTVNYGSVGTTVAEVKSGETVDAGEIILPIADQVVTGQITDEKGQPVKFTYVMVAGRKTDGRGAMSDAEGRFHIKGVVSEDVTLKVRATDYQPFQLKLTPDNFQDVKVELQK